MIGPCLPEADTTNLRYFFCVDLIFASFLFLFHLITNYPILVPLNTYARISVHSRLGGVQFFPASDESVNDEQNFLTL